MKIASYDIQPFLLYLPDEPVWVERWNQMKDHLAEVGLLDETIHIAGIHGEKFGIAGTHPFELDNPGGHHMIGSKYTSSFLSQYVMYSCANVHPASHFMFMEGDTRFHPGWRENLETALKNIPRDFDFLFVGSCHARHHGEYQISGSNVWKYPRTKVYPCKYPMCGNCYIIAKKCLPHVIATQRDAYAHADVSLAIHSFPKMEVYSILPSLAYQLNNPLPE